MIERHGELFLNRVFTPREIEYCSSRKAATQHYAGRWAAKEAILKALGTGLGARYPVARYGDSQRRGRQALAWPWAAVPARCASSWGLPTCMISISHCRTHATAFAVAVGADGETDPTRGIAIRVPDANSSDRRRLTRSRLAGRRPQARSLRCMPFRLRSRLGIDWRRFSARFFFAAVFLRGLLGGWLSSSASSSRPPSSRRSSSCVGWLAWSSLRGPFGQQLDGLLERQLLGRRTFGQRGVGRAVGDVRAVAPVEQLDRLAGHRRGFEDLRAVPAAPPAAGRASWAGPAAASASSSVTSSGDRSAGSDRVSAPHLT